MLSSSNNTATTTLSEVRTCNSNSLCDNLPSKSCSINNNSSITDSDEDKKVIINQHNQAIKMFIGGVPPHMKVQELYELFQDTVRPLDTWPTDFTLSNVSCHQGFGFIDISGIPEGKLRKLLKDLRLIYNGRKFDVRIAIDRKFARQKMMKNKDKKLLVNNIAPEITHKEMEEYFSSLGPIDRTYVAYDPKSGKCKGFGFVIFENLEDAMNALAIKNHFIGNCQVQVNKNM